MRRTVLIRPGGRIFSPSGQFPPGDRFGEDWAASVEEVGMLGRREWVAAAVAALMSGVAVVVLAGLDDGEVVEVRVQGRAPALPELTRIGDTSTTTASAAVVLLNADGSNATEGADTEH
jgi:hypothetical protein